MNPTKTVRSIFHSYKSVSYELHQRLPKLMAKPILFALVGMDREEVSVCAIQDAQDQLGGLRPTEHLTAQMQAHISPH